MKKLLTLIALFLAACGGASDPGEVVTTPVTMMPPPGPAAFMGDSITFDWALPTGYINAGIPGDTSQMMLARFQADVMSHAPSVVAILAGTNDLRYADTPSLDAIATMAVQARAKAACVILATIPPIIPSAALYPAITSQAQMDGDVAAFNQQIMQLVHDNGYLLADYHSVLVNIDGTQNSSLFYYDGIHPTAAGDAVMWKVVAPLIDQCNGGR